MSVTSSAQTVYFLATHIHSAETWGILAEMHQYRWAWNQRAGRSLHHTADAHSSVRPKLHGWSNSWVGIYLGTNSRSPIHFWWLREKTYSFVLKKATFSSSKECFTNQWLTDSETLRVFHQQTRYKHGLRFQKVPWTICGWRKLVESKNSMHLAYPVIQWKRGNDFPPSEEVAPSTWNARGSRADLQSAMKSTAENQSWKWKPGKR